MLLITLREAVRSLWGAKQRTFLALLGVTIGIGSVMAMLTIGDTTRAEALRRFKNMATDVIVLRPGYGPSHGSRMKATVLTLDLLDRVAKYSKTIRLMSPEVQIYGLDATLGRSKIKVNLVGIRSEYFQIKGLAATRGRLFSFLDRGRRVALLGAEAARNFGMTRSDPPLKDGLTVRGSQYTVVGILSPAKVGMNSGEVDRAVFLPIETASRLSGSLGVTLATARIGDNVNHDRAQTEINELVSRLGSPGDSVQMESPRKTVEQIAKQMDLYTLLLAAIGSISLVVGGIGIMNMMLISVAERRQEIGIRRAMGGRRRHITGQFLVESIILCIAGGLLGMGLGIGGGYGVAHLQGAQLVVSTKAVIICLAVAFGSGTFFGYYPARKAAAMEIILALKAD